MRHSPGLAPVMWRGIREMNVFRISNNQRIISTPSAFKSKDPSRLKRHFDWESKSSLPLGTKDNEGVVFPQLSFYCHSHVWGDCQLEVITPYLSLTQLTEFSLLFYSWKLLSNIKLWADKSHMSIHSLSLDLFDFPLAQSVPAAAFVVAPSPGFMLGNDLWHNYGKSVNM